MPRPETPRFESEHIEDYQDGRQDLPQDRGQRRSRDPHIQREKEQIIQHEVQSNAGHGTDQRIAGTAV